MSAVRRLGAGAKRGGHRRERGSTMWATSALRWDPDTKDLVEVVVDVNDALTKNERYRVGKRGQHARLLLSDRAIEFREAVARAFAGASPDGLPLVVTGAWRLDVLTVWPRERHLGDEDFAHGDSDAGLSSIKDALQHAKVLDDDVRVVADRTWSTYRKGERRTVARLVRLSDYERTWLFGKEVEAMLERAPQGGTKEGAAS